MTNQQTGGFLDRLNEKALSRRRVDHTVKIKRRMEAITCHLEQLLNTRKGSSASHPDFGLEDFNNIGADTADTITQISADIIETINTFEPRIHIVDVHYEGDKEHPLELTFTIKGHMRVDNQRESVAFEMALDRLNHQWRHTKR